MGSLGAPEILLMLMALGTVFIFPIWGYSAGSKRVIGPVGGLLLGFFLNLFGIIIVYCTRKIEEPKFYNFNNSSSPADEIQKFKQLLDSGAISDDEYNRKKTEILNR